MSDEMITTLSLSQRASLLFVLTEAATVQNDKAEPESTPPASIEELIAAGHAAADVWSMTPRAMRVWLGLERKRRRAELLQITDVEEADADEIEVTEEMSEETAVERAWRDMDEAPDGEVVQLIVAGFVDWIYAARDEDGAWLDANGTAVTPLAWRSARGK